MTRTLWIGGALLCLASLLLYGFGAHNPNPLRWSALLMLMTGVTALWVWRGGSIQTACPLVWAVAVFVVYAGLSLLWSPDWREGIIRYHNIVLLAGLFLAAIHADRAKLISAVSLTAAGAIFIEIAISVHRPTIFGALGNENFQAEFLVILAPLAFMGFRSKYAPVCVLAGCGALVQAFAFNASDANYAALAGVFLLGLVWLVKNRKYTTFAVIFIPSIIGFVLVFDRFIYSLLFRIEFAINTIFMWSDYPLFGVGLGGFNYTYPEYQERHTQWVSPGIDGTALHNVTNFVGAAHNEFMQALATFGIFGAGILAAIIWLAPRENIYALVALASAVGLSLVGFPMQNPATAVPIILALALSSRQLRSSPRVLGI